MSDLTANERMMLVLELLKWLDQHFDPGESLAALTMATVTLCIAIGVRADASDEQIIDKLQILADQILIGADGIAEARRLENETRKSDGRRH